MNRYVILLPVISYLDERVQWSAQNCHHFISSHHPPPPALVGMQITIKFYLAPYKNLADPPDMPPNRSKHNMRLWKFGKRFLCWLMLFLLLCRSPSTFPPVRVSLLILRCPFPFYSSSFSYFRSFLSLFPSYSDSSHSPLLFNWISLSCYVTGQILFVCHNTPLPPRRLARRYDHLHR